MLIIIKFRTVHNLFQYFKQKFNKSPIYYKINNINLYITKKNILIDLTLIFIK